MLKKTKEMWIIFHRSSRQVADPVCVGNVVLQRVDTFKLLGVHEQNNFKWNALADDILSRASKRLYFLSACRKDDFRFTFRSRANHLPDQD